MPDWAGLLPWFASVKTSVVADPSAMEAAPNVFATVGAIAFTTRHWSDDAFVAPVAVTFAARFVNAAGLPAQLGFTCAAWLPRPETVTVQLAVPAVMAMPVSPERTRVPPLYAALAGPEHPAEYATAGVAEAKRRPDGSVSPSAMPPSAGLPAPFASVKTSDVDALSLIEPAAKVFATDGCTTVSVWLVTAFARPLAAVICAAPFTAAPSAVPRTPTVIVHTCPAVDRDRRSP